ncbi:MAG: FliO/MopB family protein [Thermodesulfobacteria bacterium]|nr:FliO/MopB family protein [Thermodesulfobacteriota bacterium]
MSVGLYLQVIGLVLFLCGLLVLASWAVRRLRARTQGPLGESIKVKAVRPLTYKSQLALVEVLGEKILIGLGEGGPRLICKLEGKKDEDHPAR